MGQHIGITIKLLLTGAYGIWKLPIMTLNNHPIPSFPIQIC